MIKNLFLLTRYKRLVNVPVKDIILIERAKDYSRFVTKNANYLVKAPLTELEQGFAQYGFCRVHRSYIVQLEKIDEIVDDIIHIDGKHVPMGKTYQQELFLRLDIIR